MAIQGVGSHASIPTVSNTPATADVLKTPAQKIADAAAEANAGINDGDEKPTLTSTINTHA